MTLKSYQTIKLLVVILLGVVFGMSVVRGLFLLPIALLVASVLFLLLLRRRVGEVIADERDWQTGGKAALLAMQIYAWVVVAAMFVLLAERATNPLFEPIATVLAYSTCVLLLMYALIFRYYSRVAISKRHAVFSLFVGTAVVVLVIVGVRLFSGEDSWMCVKGEWVKHGQPSRPMPEVGCVDGTPYFYHDNLSGLQIAYAQAWQDHTWVETVRTRDYREVGFYYRAASGQRPLLLQVTIYPNDVGTVAEPWATQDVVLRNDRYVVTAVRPAAADYAMTGDDRAAFERLAGETDLMIKALRFDHGNVGRCESYPLEACPAECVVCPPCPECSSVSCQTAQTCREMDIGRDWYEQILARVVLLDKYKTDGQVISWDETRGLLDRCLVSKIAQSHARKVSLTLVTGRRLATTEPKLDDVIAVARALGDKCGNISVATE